MKQVDHYEVEVKYSGKITDYTTEQLYEMAKAAQDRRGDFSPAYTLKLLDKDARLLDGAMGVLVDFPDNHVCVFGFSFIREEGEA